ncbi:unnamed protein product [Arctogadus glacialis]
MRLERNVLLQNLASVYAVRKIRESIATGEQSEKPIFTPCSAKAEGGDGHGSKGNSQAALAASELDGPEEPDPRISSGNAVQKLGS